MRGGYKSALMSAPGGRGAAFNPIPAAALARYAPQSVSAIPKNAIVASSNPTSNANNNRQANENRKPFELRTTKLKALSGTRSLENKTVVFFSDNV